MFNKKLIENIFSLFVLQGSNYVLPLLTFPFLVRMLGTANFGITVFTTAFMQMFAVVTDYGFNVTATKKITLNKHSIMKVNQIYNKVLTIKVLLTFLSFLLLLVLISFVPKLRVESGIYLVGFLAVIGNAIFPLWFFQGMENMRYITLLNVSAKFLSTILIFVFIRTPSNTELAVLFQSFNFLLPGLIALLFIRLKFGVKFRPIFSVQVLKEELIEGVHVFMTNVWINVYVQGAVIITGFVAGDKAAGLYGIGQKVTAICAGFMQPVGQAIYPHMCTLYENNIESFRKFKTNIIKVGVIASVSLSLILLIFSKDFLLIFAGYYTEYTNDLIKLFAVATFFIMLNSLLTTIIFVMNKYTKLQKVYLSIAVVFCIASIPLTFYYGAYGMISSIIFVEGYVFIACLLLAQSPKAKRFRLKP
ncbi:oligosaccharide flippase family protein [Ectobacillus sp. sgz5001026]|uniref:oligosaccharide flippase family protein n=1 Tax=Ectobacillus sp. sgz5001026 TaxID=3242473 RepID=UPI0036D21D47